MYAAFDSDRCSKSWAEGIAFLCWAALARAKHPPVAHSPTLFPQEDRVENWKSKSEEKNNCSK